MADVANLIAELLGEGLWPMAEALSRDAAEQRTFLLQLGYSVSTPPTVLATLPAAALPLVNALVALDEVREAMDADAATENDVDNVLLQVFAGVVAVAAAVKTVGSLTTAELPDFENRFYETLLVRTIFTERPILFAVLAFLGIFELLPQTLTDGSQQIQVPTFKLHTDRVGKLLTDPRTLLKDVYGFGTSQIDTTTLFTNLSRLATLLGVVPSIQYPTGEMATAYGVATPTDFTGLARQLVFPIGDLGDVAFALGLYAVPAPASTPQPLALTLEVTGETSETFTLTPSAVLELDVKGAVATGLGILLSPNQPPTLLSNVMGTGGVSPLSNASAGLTLTLTDATEPPIQGATGIEILSLGGGSALRAEQIAISATASTKAGQGPDILFGFALAGGKAVLAPGQGDGFLTSVLPAKPIEAKFDMGLQWSRANGVHFLFSGGLEATLALNLTVGPITVDALHLAVAISNALGLDFSIDGSVKLGPVSASVQGIGGRLLLEFKRGNLGPFEVTSAFKAPTGIGLAIDAGSVHGGGFISFDPDAGRYSGALQLSIYDIAISAFGLIETKVPGVSYSFVIIISAEFTPIQLGFGFTLNGVGGILGINRGIDTDALSSLVRAGQSENLLFPKNVVADAPTIVRDLTSVFPATQGRYVFGPLGKLGWGTPTLITGEIGIILEIPGPVVVILGEVKCILPKPDAALVKFNLSIDGELDFPNKRFAMDAALHDSVINGYPVSGQMAMRVTWGDQPNFVFSIGGFHPAYTPPPNFPKLQPLALDLGKQGAATITVSGFFAVTSNTVQVGGQARLHAGGGGISLDASVSVKALFVFSPFSFEADIDASVKISFHGYGPSVHLSGMLKGPSPWRVKGRVCVSILWWDACLGFDVTFGNNQPESQPELDPWEPADSAIVGLRAALSDPGNWSGAALPGAVSSVTRAQGTDTLIDPVGGLTVRQKVAPVETPQPLTKFGVAKVATPVSFSNVQATLGDTGAVSLTAASPINEHFAPAQFFDMGDAKKLSSPGFEQYQAGYLFATAASPKNVQAGSNAAMTLTIETFVIGSDGSETKVDDYTPSNAHVTGTNQRSAVAKRGLPLVGTRRFINRTLTPAFTEKVLTYVIASTSTLKAVSGAPAASVRSAALIALDTFRAQNVEQAAGVQVAATHELAA